MLRRLKLAILFVCFVGVALSLIGPRISTAWGQIRQSEPVQSLAGPATAAAGRIESEAAGLHQIGPVDLDRVRAMAHDLDPSVRIHALAQCGSLAGSKEAAAAVALAESCLKDSDPKVRQKALDTLEQLGVEDAKRLAADAVQRYAAEISRKAGQLAGSH